MVAVVRCLQANEDQLDIWLYIAGDDQAAADQMVDKIDRALTMLARNPLAGRSRPELVTDLRSFPVGNYVVFSKPRPDGIDVVRILSGYRDISPDHMF